MVTLSKIYTRTGDGGETAIGDGSRVSKLDLRIRAGGSIDETNSHLGVAIAHCEDSELRTVLVTLQQRLFDLGADVTCPWSAKAEQDKCPRISDRHIKWLEDSIDRFNAQLSPLQSFILPGGSHLAAAIHVARSVCRRAELDTIHLKQETDINPQIAIFLNRVSDLLFVAARVSNNNGTDDVLWAPNVPE